MANTTIVLQDIPVADLQVARFTAVAATVKVLGITQETTTPVVLVLAVAVALVLFLDKLFKVLAARVFVAKTITKVLGHMLLHLQVAAAAQS